MAMLIAKDGVHVSLPGVEFKGDSSITKIAKFLASFETDAHLVKRIDGHWYFFEDGHDQRMSPGDWIVRDGGGVARLAHAADVAQFYTVKG